MFPTITIGPFVLPTAGLIYILGIWVTLSLIERAALGLTLDAQAVYTMGTLALVFGFIGARLTFVALHWPAYQQNLLGILWPLTSGFELWAGLIAGSVAAFFYGRARQLPLAPTLDALAPGLLLALMVVSLADFVGGSGYGTETNLPWGISPFGVPRHPVQIYEILIGLLALAVWWRAFDRRTFAGQLFLLSTAVYSAGRLFVDAFRTNAWLTAGGYHVVQIISLFVLLAALLLLARQRSDL